MTPYQRYTFNQEQLDQYFDRIALPKASRVNSISTLDSSSQLSLLTTLHKHQIVTVPFETLIQHYSWHQVIDLNPLHLYRKITTQPGRGGYCLEVNYTFHNLLRSIGFRCYLVSGRAKEPTGAWTGWAHLVNIVVIGGTKYLCDVGFGRRETTVPLPLIPGEVRPQVAPAESRLVLETLEENISDCKLWFYQYRIDAEAEWTSAYCFSETEVLPGDLKGLNYAPSIDRSSPFAQHVVCVRFTTDKEHVGAVDGLPSTEIVEQGEIDGTLVLIQDKLKWRRKGKDVIERELKSEEDRLQALKKYWGIELDIEDQMAIIGTVSAIST